MKIIIEVNLDPDQWNKENLDTLQTETTFATEGAIGLFKINSRGGIGSRGTHDFDYEISSRIEP